jgi:hypothetical protein
MNESPKRTRRRALALVALAAVAVIGGTVAEPVRALAAPTVSGSKTKAPHRDARPPTPPSGKIKAKSATKVLPVGEAQFLVPRSEQAITAFRVRIDADLSTFDEVQISFENLTEDPNVSTVLYFAVKNYDDKILGNGDRVSALLNVFEEQRHLLFFDLNSDYTVAEGCAINWPDGVRQENWSVRITGVPAAGGPRQGIPLDEVVVTSFNSGEPCPANLMQHLHLKSCLNPSESPVVQPTPGQVRGCTLNSIARPGTIKAP